MRVLVYKYGLLPPILNGDLVFDQIQKAHQYRNKLTEITRAEREGLRNIERKVGDMAALEKAVADADALVVEGLQAIKASRARTHQRTESKVMRDKVNEAKKAKRDAVTALRNARVVLRTDPKVQEAKEKNHEKRNAHQRMARAASDVYWGTYLLSEAADQSSQKMPLFKSGEPVDPHFRRWTGEGQVGIQIQGGINASRAFSSVDTRLQISEQEHVIDKPAMTPGVAAHRARLKALRNPNPKKKRGVLSLRIGSDQSRDPVWAQWPILIHRPLPEGAKIKTATVSRRLFGPKVEWSCELTIEVPDVVPVPAKAKVVGIDLGWRQLPDGTIRVGTWTDNEGREGQWILPPRIQSAVAKVEGLRSLRDRLMNEMKPAFSTHLIGLMQGPEGLRFDRLPAWLIAATSKTDSKEPLTPHEFLNRFNQWRSQGRFAALAHKWKENRFVGDSEAYGCLEAWRYQDYHLWAWEAGTRRSTLRFRKDFYRNIASVLGKTYETIILEDFNLAEVARAARPGENDSVNETANANRFLVSPSELKGAIIQAAASHGRKLVEEDAKDTTRKCHACGKICNWDQAADLVHTCEGCGATWDQDPNASRNLVNRWLEIEKDGGAQLAEKTEVIASATSKRHELRMAKKKAKKDLSQTAS